MTIAIIQLVLSVTIIALILLQERSAGLGGIFGGEGGGFYQARRGLERVVFIATIVAVVAFAGLALYQLVV